MLSYLTDPTYGVVEITVDGAISAADYDAVVKEMDGAIGHYGKLNLIEVIEEVGSIDSTIWWRDIKWGFAHVKHIARCAVVTDKGWIGPISRAVGALVAAEIRVFPLARLDDAREWVRGH